MSNRFITWKSGSVADVTAWVLSFKELVTAWGEPEEPDFIASTFRLAYPLNIKLPRGLALSGLELLEAKLDTKQLMKFPEKFSLLLDELMAVSKGAQLVFKCVRLDRPKRNCVRLRCGKNEKGMYAYYYPDVSSKEPLLMIRAFEDFFVSLEAGIRVELVGDGMKFVPSKGTEIEIKTSTDELHPDSVILRRTGWAMRHLVSAIEGTITRSKLKLSSTELFVSFPAPPPKGAHGAARQIIALNAANLPIRKATCEVYCQLRSWRDFPALRELRAMDCDHNPIEQVVAQFVTPGGVPGILVVGATKSGFAVELHAKEAPDEEAFVRELKVLLKKHLN